MNSEGDFGMELLVTEIVALLSAGTCVVGIIGLMYHYSSISQKEESVQSGYVLPSKLEKTVEDKDHDGKNEVYLNYDGKEYPLKSDEQGKPVIKY